MGRIENRVDALEELLSVRPPTFLRDMPRPVAARLFVEWLNVWKTLPDDFFAAMEDGQRERLRLAVSVSFDMAKVRLQFGSPVLWTEGTAPLYVEGARLDPYRTCRDCGFAVPTFSGRPVEERSPVTVCPMCGGAVGHYGFSPAHDGTHPNGADSRNPSFLKYNYLLEQAAFEWKRHGLLNALRICP